MEWNRVDNRRSGLLLLAVCLVGCGVDSVAPVDLGTPCACTPDEVCRSGLCVAASCGDALRNGGESDVDCGGDKCQPCFLGDSCGGDRDCQSGRCVDGLCSEPLTFRPLGNSVLTFDSRSTRRVELADLDGDGVTEYLVNGNQLAVYDRDLMLIPGSNVGIEIMSMNVADFTGDGKADILVGTFDGAARIVAGDGHGVFPCCASFGRGVTWRAMVGGDFNGDGRRDLVAASSDLMILDGRGDGTFALPRSITPAGLAGFHQILSRDLDGDGHLDLVAVSAVPSVQFGRGDGTFEPAVTFESPAADASISLGYVDGDHRLDLLVASPADKRLTVYRQSKVREFVFAIRTVGDQPARTLVGDLDEDGRDDIILFDKQTLLRISTGDGLFTSGEVLTTQFNVSVHGGVLGDFDGDGHLDLCTEVADGVPSIAAGDGLGHFGPIHLPGNAESTLVTGDWNRDGRLDLAQITPERAMLYWNQGAGRFTAWPVAGWTGGLITSDIGDHDADGKVDLVAAGDGLLWRPGDGAGGFGGVPVEVATSVSVRESVLADFDGDGRSDVLLGGPGLKQELALVRGLPGGRLAAPISSMLDAAASGLQALDVDGDGHLDLYVAEEMAGRVAFLRGDGRGGFFPPAPGHAAAAPTQLGAADLDGDSHPDVLALTSDGIVALRGDRTGQLGSLGVALGFRSATTAFVVADFDADGRPDVAFTAKTRGGPGSVVDGLMLARGDGSGGFLAPQSVRIPASPVHMKAADLNGDRRLDLVMVNALGQVSTWRNVIP